MDDITMIGTRIKIRRKEMNLTQKDIYAATGISTGNLSEIERGNVLPSSKALILLSPLLQTSIDWLLTGKSLISEYSPVELSNTEYQLKLTETEELMIYMYRGLGASEQDEIRNYIRSKVAASEKMGKSSTSSNGKKHTRDDAVIA